MNQKYVEDIDIDSTHIHLKCDVRKDVKPFIIRQRQIIKDTITRNPGFDSFNPVKVESDERIINLMVKAGLLSDTGAMASVAGSISQVVLEFLAENGSEYAVVENGGDIAFCVNEKTVISVYAGCDNPFSYNVGFKIKPEKRPYGICTSAQNGCSISLGDTDATVVFAQECSVADAFATKIANSGTGCGDYSIVENALGKAEECLDVIDGCVIIKGEILAKTGRVPGFVKINNEKISSLYEII